MSLLYGAKLIKFVFLKWTDKLNISITTMPLNAHSFIGIIIAPFYLLPFIFTFLFIFTPFYLL